MVTIHTQTLLFPYIDEDFLYRAADAALGELGLQNEEVTISLVSSHKIRELNRKYRGLDKTTDVLSFTSNEVNPETGRVFLGDIVISFSKVKEQARTAGNSVRDELALMVVHGILHLHGLDHADKASELEMFNLQDEILAAVKRKSQPIKSESITRSFKFAILGILSALRSERNMWVHLAAAVLVVIAGLVLDLSALEWAAVTFAIALVIVTELINTALEYTVNLLREERDERVRRIKDISAAAVLAATTASVVIAALVLLPKVLANYK